MAYIQKKIQIDKTSVSPIKPSPGKFLMGGTGRIVSNIFKNRKEQEGNQENVKESTHKHTHAEEKTMSEKRSENKAGVAQVKAESKKQESSPVAMRKTTKGKGRTFRSADEGAGMTAKGVAQYKKENPGSKLKTAVTGKVKPGSKAAKRRKSFCARSKGWTGERGKAARRRWKC